MGLHDEIMISNKDARFRCGYATLLATIPEPEHTELKELVNNPQIKTTAIVQVLSKRYVFAKSSIARHRQGVCSCESR